MYRRHFFLLVVLSLCFFIFLSWLIPSSSWLLAVWVMLTGLGIYDLRCRHNVLNNYPVIGHLRYLLEFIRPELRQYFFESESSGRPFNREQREIINKRADGVSDAMPFGTVNDIEHAGYDLSYHSLSPKQVDDSYRCVTIGGPQCGQPYHSSRFNISSMSFGAISGKAIQALNLGAKQGGFAQVTGEGGISPYHQQHGGDLVWQIGTGYFGCRTQNGGFSAAKFEHSARSDQVKMIELKLSQGAKPAHGGLLPASKITEEIAETRDVPMGEDCLSPPTHKTFSTPEGLLQFIQQLREMSGGKPVGFKLCIGYQHEFLGICKAMLETNILPDFITIDGAEGGTGAAPTEFSDRLGLFINEALYFVHNALVGVGLRDQIKLIVSGKVALGYDMVVKKALGADLFHAARPYMFAIGCIQSRRCHTNNCPTGIATQDERRSRAINVHGKARRVQRYHDATLTSFLELTAAMGLTSPDELTPEHIEHRVDDAPAVTYSELYGPALTEGCLVTQQTVPVRWQKLWDKASATRF